MSKHTLPKHYRWGAIAATVGIAVTTAVTVPLTARHVTHQYVTPSTCRSQGELQDPACTPGVADPRVTQANIQTTICVNGYTSGVRPPVSYTNPLKVKLMQEYGVPSGTINELDHLIPLELGGSPTDEKNLWAEVGSIPNPKDKVENELHKRVCNGTMTLLEAQARISNNWVTALQ